MNLFQVGIRILIPFSFLWLLVAITTTLDLTVIGHIKGWKKIKYSKFFSWFVSGHYLGSDLIQDEITHPQVIAQIISYIFVFFGLFAGTIAFAFHAHRFDPWVTIGVDIVLYSLAIIHALSSKIYTMSLYRNYKNTHNHITEDNNS